MKTDHLDLVQFHSSPSKAELEEQGGLQALQDLQRQGKVRFIGISGTIPNLKEQIDMGVFDVFQIPYSALEREHEALIEYAVPCRGRDHRPGWRGEGRPGQRAGRLLGESGSASASTICSTACRAWNSSCASLTVTPTWTRRSSVR